MTFAARVLFSAAVPWALMAAMHAAGSSESHAVQVTPALVPSFYARAVTGPLMNRSVCYVCRHGSRPVVMVVVRRTSPELQTLLQGVDAVVDRHRADGLRSFAVIVCGDPQQAVPAVQTFAFDGKIAMPLCVASEAVAGTGGLELDEQAEVSILLYRNRRIESTAVFRRGELSPAAIPAVLDQVRAFAAAHGAAGRVE